MNFIFCKLWEGFCEKVQTTIFGHRFSMGGTGGWYERGTEELSGETIVFWSIFLGFKMILSLDTSILFFASLKNLKKHEFHFFCKLKKPQKT